MDSKKMLSAAAALMMVAVAHGQTLNIYLNDGSRLSYDAAQVDSITIEPKAVTIDVQVADVTASSAQVTVNCADPSVRYYFDLCTLSAYERYGSSVSAIVDEYIAQTAAEYAGRLTLDQILDAMLDSGMCNEQITSLPSDTEMIAYAVAVDDEGRSYGPESVARFRTLPPGDPADCTFQIMATDISTDGCVVNIVPSDSSVPYWYGIVAVDEYIGDRAMMTSVTAAFKQAAAEYGMQLDELVERIAYRGAVSQSESGLQSNVAYYIFAFALNADGTNAGPLTKQRFTTSEYELSDAEVSISYRYFDGNALCELDAATYERYRGGIMVQVHVEPGLTAAHWSLGLGANDMTDTVTYPDESTKLALLSGMGRNDQTDMNFAARYGMATFVYFAADAAGIDGQLKRLLVEFTPGGVSDPSALTDTASVRMHSSVPAFSQAPCRGRIASRLGRVGWRR